MKEIGIAVWALVCFLISTYIGYTAYWPSVTWVLNTSDHQLLFYVAILPYTVGVLVWWIGAVLVGWMDPECADAAREGLDQHGLLGLLELD